jgi:hypothetical protein
MKRHLFAAIIAAICMAICLPCCKKSTNNPETPVPEYVAQGTIKVVEPQFEKDKIRLTASLLTDTTLRLAIDSVRFSDEMQMTLSLQLFPVNYTRQGEDIIFNADNAVPTIDGQQYKSYTVREMQGIIRTDSMKFTTRFGEYECEYAGKITNTRNTL